MIGVHQFISTGVGFPGAVDHCPNPGLWLTVPDSQPLCNIPSKYSTSQMKQTMRSIICTRYGPPEVLELREVAKPVPRENEVLIKIRAATVTMGDCEMRKFDFPAWIWLPLRLYMGIRKPRIKTYGQELSGEIEAVGQKVTKFKAGDQVFAPTQMHLGAHAEYICLPENFAIALKPNELSHEDVATIPTGGLNALHFVRKAKIQPGEKVLIIGAGGCIGTYAVQLARLEGAEVSCTDRTEKLDMLRSIGADEVIDFTREDFTARDQTWDVIIDTVCKGSFSGSVRCLKPHGRLVLGNPLVSTMLGALWVSASDVLTGRHAGKKVTNVVAAYTVEDLDYLKALLVAGKIKPVIDRRFSLEQMTDAHRYVDSGLKQGNVVIEVS